MEVCKGIQRVYEGRLLHAKGRRSRPGVYMDSPLASSGKATDLRRASLLRVSAPFALPPLTPTDSHEEGTKRVQRHPSRTQIRPLVHKTPSQSGMASTTESECANANPSEECAPQFPQRSRVGSFVSTFSSVFTYYRMQHPGRERGRWKRLRMFLRHPSDRFQEIYLKIAVSLIVFQAIFIPFRASYDVSQNALWWAVDGLVELFFIFDMWYSYFREMRQWHLPQGKVAPLISDAAALFPLQLIAIASGKAVTAAFILNKLLRLRRARELYSKLEHSATVNPSILRIFVLTAVVAITAHWAACGWFAIVSEQSEMHIDFVQDPILLTRARGSQYMRSMLWSVLALTGYGNSQPHTELETFYAFSIALIGVGLQVTVIGTVGSLLAEFDSSMAMFRSKLETVNEYLSYRKLPPDLRQRVLTYYHYLWQQKRGLDESNTFQKLPQQLQVEISMAQYGDIIRRVPMFREADQNLLAHLVAQLSPRLCLPNYYIVRKGSLGKEMYILAKGSVDILGDDESTVVVTLSDGSFFGEVALTHNVPRTASVRAKTVCDLFVLTQEDFQRVLEQFPDVRSSILEAADKRMQAMRVSSPRQDEDEDEEINDLQEEEPAKARFDRRLSIASLCSNTEDTPMRVVPRPMPVPNTTRRRMSEFSAQPIPLHQSPERKPPRSRRESG